MKCLKHTSKKEERGAIKTAALKNLFFLYHFTRNYMIFYSIKVLIDIAARNKLSTPS